MFNKMYDFKGIHADMVRQLTGFIAPELRKGLFSRNLDVYILAPIVGFLYSRKSPIDKTSIDPTKIFPEQMIGAEEELIFNYRLIMLLDKDNEPDEAERIKHAFQYIGKPEGDADLVLYDEYVRGGVEVLYEKLIKQSIDIIKNLYEFIEEFNDRYSDMIDTQALVALCKKAKDF